MIMAKISTPWLTTTPRPSPTAAHPRHQVRHYTYDFPEQCELNRQFYLLTIFIKKSLFLLFRETLKPTFCGEKIFKVFNNKNRGLSSHCPLFLLHPGLMHKTNSIILNSSKLCNIYNIYAFADSNTTPISNSSASTPSG